MTRAIDTSTLPDDTVREALEWIAENLRDADRAEIAATTTEDPFWAIFESWQGSSISWLIIDPSGLPIGIMGVAPHLTPKVGVAWMIGTPEVETRANAHSIARQTRHYLEEMHRFYPVLWANVDARNDLSMKWLVWSGFDLTWAQDFGPESRPFLQFIRTP